MSKRQNEKTSATADSETGSTGGRRLVRRRGPVNEQRTRSLGWLILGTVVVLVLTVSFAGARSYQDLKLARERAAKLEGEIQETQLRVEELRRTGERLESDPVAIDRAIREELGLVGDDQLVVVLPIDENP